MDPETVLVESRIRRLVKDSAGLRVSSEFLSVLDEELKKIILFSAATCSGDGRRTLRASDLPLAPEI